MIPAIQWRILCLLEASVGQGAYVTAAIHISLGQEHIDIVGSEVAQLPDDSLKLTAADATWK